MSDDVVHRCRVCGLWTEDLPYGADGQTWEWVICPCCGAEHGYEDITIEGVRRYREAWLAAGAKWSEPEEAPDAWDRDEQLAHVPTEFR